MILNANIYYMDIRKNEMIEDEVLARMAKAAEEEGFIGEIESEKFLDICFQQIINN